MSRALRHLVFSLFLACLGIAAKPGFIRSPIFIWVDIYFDVPARKRGGSAGRSRIEHA